MLPKNLLSAHDIISSLPYSKLGNNLYLVQTFFTQETGPSQICPIYKWSEVTFNQLNGLPCSNAMHVEPFIVQSDVFVAVANYRDGKGNLRTESYLYKLNVARSRFELAQKFRTHGAEYIKYVQVVHNGRPHHFLLIANAGDSADQKGTSNVIVYKYIDGHMMAHQQIHFDNAVKQLLPVLV